MAQIRSWSASVRSGTPRVVWLLTLLFVVVGVWWSILVPPSAPPDEPAHVDLVMAVAETGRFPDYDGRVMSEGSLFLRYPSWERSSTGERLLTPAGAPPRSSRPTYEQTGADRPATWPRGPNGEKQALMNQMPQHGPLYYSVAAISLRAGRAIGGGQLPVDREVLGLRLLGVAMVAHLPLAAFWAARRLGAGDQAATVAAVVPLCVPQLAHVSAAVSYTPLLIGLSAVMAVPVAGVVAGDRRRSTAIAIGVVSGLALWTSASAVLLLPWVALAYASQLRSWSHDRVRSAASGAFLAVGVAVAVGGFWWVRNLVRFGTPTPSTDSDHYATLVPRPGFEPDAGLLLELARDWLPVRFFGAFGTTFDAQIGSGYVTLLLALTALGALAALLPRRFGLGDGLTTVRVAVFASPLALLLAFVLYRSWSLYSSSGRVTFLQGRYLFGAFVSFATVVGAGWWRIARRAAAPTLLAVAAITQVEAGRAALDHWWSEPGSSIRSSLAAVSRWNPWFDGLPHLLVAIMVVLAVITAIDLIWRVPGVRALLRRRNEAG